MTAVIINNATPFGLLTNEAIAELHTVAEAMTRLQAAVATASGGFAGTEGTEFETDTNFGVKPGANPGDQGKNYRYAVDNLTQAWATFWDSAKPSIDAIDNGVRTP
jgi:hypothetical protein